MPCEDCGSGVWECSETGETCDGGGAGTDEGTWCLLILTKKVGDDCKLDMKLIKPNQSDATPGGWSRAGKLCVDASLREDDARECVVRLENITVS